MINAQLLSSKPRISGIEKTSDLLSDRGGLLPLLRYVDRTGIVQAISEPLAQYRHSGKGIGIPCLLRQVIAFLMDGSSRHIKRLDELRKDPGYCAVLELLPKDMASSDQVERVFGSSVPCGVLNLDVFMDFDHKGG